MSLVATLLSLTLAADPAPRPGRYFKITVADEQTGRGVPLVELTTVNGIRLYTDSNGVCAFREPGLMGQSVFFHVKSHGYEFPKDGFGFRGKALVATEGGSARLAIKRLNIAERLYRVTGAGVYRDSTLVGQPVPIRHPLLNAQVLGSDSVVNAVYRGKVHWFWGDTLRPGYPLGNFHVPGATSELPSAGGLDPAAGIDLQYFTDAKGFAKETCRMPGEGPTWIFGLSVVRDPNGRERMFAAYMKVRNQLEVYEHGLAEFNDDKQQFEKVTAFPADAPFYPGGHPFTHRSGGVDYLYFATPYPLIRVRANPDALRRLEEYEAYTCLKPGSKRDKPELDRDPDGRLRYAWKKNAPVLGPQEQARLIKDGRLKPREALLHLQDVDTGESVLAHAGSVYWNAYRGRWVMIAVQQYGKSFLGEVWYAEADGPLGPWVYARKIATHDRYSFYNPKQHPMFDKDNGRTLFFEGTYTHSFSGNADMTPRYEYNQVLYKLSLNSARMHLPVAVYALEEGDRPSRFGTVRKLRQGQKAPVAFFAYDRGTNGAVSVESAVLDGANVLYPAGTLDPVFLGLRADLKNPPKNVVPLYEYVAADGRHRFYSTDAARSDKGYRRAEPPLCLVWRSPVQSPPRE